MSSVLCLFVFFFNDTATTEIYTLSLHDALPICGGPSRSSSRASTPIARCASCRTRVPASRKRRAVASSGGDRKSTRLNSSHANISYAVFCLKKKKKTIQNTDTAFATFYTDFHHA